VKLVAGIILPLFIFFKSTAQSSDSTIKYIWKNDASNITASVEIYGLKKADNSYCIFYLNAVDTVYNNNSDSLFNTFVNISTLNCPILKISFYDMLDTVPAKKIKLYGQEFSKFILADVHKKYPQIRTNNPIISGVNYFAIVALSASINNPIKINKTALFFNKNSNIGELRDIGIGEVKNLKGKLYIYINHENIGDNFADFLVNDIALNSSTVLYKFDYFGDIEPSKVFEEAYNWLLADGNNYIIRNDN
jgi:hypothetical protein